MRGGTARGLLFIPVRRDDFLLRAELGVVLADSREGIPSTFVFRTGGDQTVRGYAFESLGVQSGNAVNTNTSWSTSGVPRKI